jgi:hypothetical protein
MKRLTYLFVFILIVSAFLLLFQHVQPEPEKHIPGKQVSEKLKSAVVQSARAIFRNHQVVLPVESVPKVEYDSQGKVTVEFMPVRPPVRGQRGGDNLGFVRFDPVTLQPIEILGAAP